LTEKLSGINQPTMNWGSVYLPTTWEKRYVKLIFSGPLKEKSDEKRIS
jgi:hypothetical protein